MKDRHDNRLSMIDRAQEVSRREINDAMRLSPIFEQISFLEARIIFLQRQTEHKDQYEFIIKQMQDNVNKLIEKLEERKKLNSKLKFLSEHE